MATINQIVITELEAFNKSIKDTLQQKRIDNTKDASNSLRIESNNYLYSSYGVFYFEFLNNGRAPGKFPPVDKIREWVESKPITSNLNVDQMAYLIGRSIAQNGTRIFRDKTKGIELDKKIAVLTKNLNEKLPKFVSNDIINKINKAF